MRVLVISTIYPNQALPVHAVFVRNRVCALAKSCDMKVISPVPYFPFVTLHRRYAYRKNIPMYERQGGIDVYFPRFFYVQRFLKPLDGFFLFWRILTFCYRLRKQFDFDLIDAHLAYPDGFAAVLLGKVFQKPVTITLRGHDINVFPGFPIRRYQIKYALRRADRVFAVAQALKDEATRLGIMPAKIKVIPNGVDTLNFKRVDPKEARENLRLPRDRKIILSVGHLCERKGFHHIIQALSILKRKGCSDCYVAVVGGPGVEGDFSGKLIELIQREGLERDVLLAGAQPHEKLFMWYSAADVFCLSSSKEGRPNVLLEAMACGLPIVATRVWGTPEVVCSKEYGILVDRPDPHMIAEALEQALRTDWDKHKIIDYASGQSWKLVSEKILKEYGDVLRGQEKNNKWIYYPTAKRLLKRIISLIIKIFVSPLYGYYKIKSQMIGVDRSFRGTSQLLSLIPGVMGEYIRKEFYKLTLTYCSDQCVIGFGTLFSSPECKIGENVYIGPNCAIGRVIIENDVLIGNNVHLLSGKRQHDYMDSLRPIRLQSGIYETITVKEDSWIGNGAIILAEVGRKCVVGAGSVVTRPVQDYSVVAGNPARAIRRRTSCNESD